MVPGAPQETLGSLIGRFGVPGMGEVGIHASMVILGRDSGCGIVVKNDSVSPEHAELTLRDGIWSITDLASAEGSWVDGEAVTGPTPLAPGSVIRLGQAVMVFDPRDLWTDSNAAHSSNQPDPMVVSWQPRDEPMAPSFEWPAHTRRNRWPLYGVLLVVVAAIIALILRAA